LRRLPPSKIGGRAPLISPQNCKLYTKAAAKANPLTVCQERANRVPTV
jgi:hypothetical protein